MIMGYVLIVLKSNLYLFLFKDRPNEIGNIDILCIRALAVTKKTSIPTNSNLENFFCDIAGNIMNIGTEIYACVMRAGVR